MNSADTQLTSPSLLERLRHAPRDDHAWDEFVRRYAPHISQWCRRWGLQPADAHDLTQDVLLALARQMSEFEYDAGGSFRAWLKTVTYRAWCRFIANRLHRREACGPALQALLESVPARDDLLGHLERESDWALLDMALARVQRRVWGNTWEAFRLQALEGVPGAEVARRLGMPINSVYTARSNVQKMLKEELRRLQAAEPQRRGS